MVEPFDHAVEAAAERAGVQLVEHPLVAGRRDEVTAVEQFDRARDRVTDRARDLACERIDPLELVIAVANRETVGVAALQRHVGGPPAVGAPIEWMVPRRRALGRVLLGIGMDANGDRVGVRCPDGDVHECSWLYG